MIDGREAMLVLLLAIAIVVVQLVDLARAGKEPTGWERITTGWPAGAILALIAYVYLYWR